MHSPELSVFICAHNPRPSFLERVVNALRRQDLHHDRWDLLLVDNRSERALRERFDLSWHAHAAHFREETLGLAHARLAGIRETRADLVVMLDDDSVLSSDYLTNVIKLAADHPFIGVWGGQIVVEFADPTNYFARKYPSSFTERTFAQHLWTNQKRDYGIMPTGAGLCARRAVLQRYAELCREDPRRCTLGRTGTRLFSCEDIDIVFTACDMGYGKALFHELKLTHLIPEERLCEAFVIGNVEGNQYSATIHNFLIDGTLPNFHRTFWQMLGFLYRLARQDMVGRKMLLAGERGKRIGATDLVKWGWLEGVKY